MTTSGATFGAGVQTPRSVGGSTPSVDVIVPCYNYGRFLHDCIGSVLTQQGCILRVLVIDDASTDDSLAIARALAASDTRVQVRAHETNQGHIATYNEGIGWLSSDYMLLLSSDDMVAPGAFARATGVMEANPNVGFVYGTSIRFTDEADIVALSIEHEAPPPTVENGITFIRKLCATPVNTVETASAVVRTRLQRQVGGYRPELPHSGDMEMWLRLAAHGDVGVIPAVQAFTRIHARNMHLGYKADRDLEDFSQRRLVFQTFFSGDGRNLDERRALEATAWRSLAEELLWAAARAFDEAAPPRLVSELAAAAEDLWPAITRTALWWKVRIRRAVGPSFWNGFSTARDLARNGI